MQLLAFFNAALPSLYGTPSISYCLLKDSKINECAVNYSKRKHLLSWLVCQRSAQHKEHLIISSVAFHELIYHYFIPFSCLLWARHWFQIDNSIVSATYRGSGCNVICLSSVILFTHKNEKLIKQMKQWCEISSHISIKLCSSDGRGMLNDCAQLLCSNLLAN